MPIINKRMLQFIAVALFVLASNILQAQVPDKILKSFKNGNSKTLSEYFNQNVDLVVLENDNVCSKAQAQQIISKFFNTYQPKDFTIIHQGGKEGAEYVIGKLETNNGNFRVQFLLKKSGGKDYIHQLRIDKQ